MSKKIVVFTATNARVMQGIADDSPLLSQDNVIVNPNFDQVLGVVPQYWKKGEENHVVPMDDDERIVRDGALEPKPQPQPPAPFVFPTEPHSFPKLPVIEEASQDAEVSLEVFMEEPELKKVNLWLCVGILVVVCYLTHKFGGM